jgi:DNA polymerase-1
VHYLVNTILQYREYGKLLSTYCRALREKQDAAGRIHASVNQMVCDTNRFSYSDPNLQNIPARGLLGAAFRRVFVAGPGKVIVKADFSQLELRILAHYTREPILVEAYCSEPERDIHAAFAAEWGVARSVAKNGVFAMAYMAEAETLARTIGIPREQIGPFLKEQRARMPALFGGWKQHIRNLLTMQGYVETLYGWRNYYPLYRSPIRSEAEKALREAGNLPIQGTAGGILKKLLLAYDDWRHHDGAWDSKFVLMVHDEAVFEVPQEYAPQFARGLEALPKWINPLSVPLKLEVQVGKNWGDVRPWREWAP